MFGDENPRRERFRGVAGIDRDTRLSQHFTAIQLLRHDMDRCSGLFVTGGDGWILTICPLQRDTKSSDSNRI